MIRNLKALGLALVAVFALSAVGAGSASAVQFHSEAETTTIKASQTTTHIFTSTAGEVTCEKATFAGSQVGKTVNSVKVTPTYSGCHIIIFGSTISATVATNGCEYELFAAGTANVVCPAGKSITVTGAGCTITVGAQTGKKTVSYKNNGNHIDITAALTGLSYSHSGFTCGVGSGTNGTYNGTTTAEGFTTAGVKTKIFFE